MTSRTEKTDWEVANGKGYCTFDKTVYSEDVLLKSMHRISDRYASILSETQGNWSVCLSPNSTIENIESACKTLITRALDEVLRERLQKKTEALRHLILAETFSRTSILHSDLEIANPAEDPENIHSPDPMTNRNTRKHSGD